MVDILTHIVIFLLILNVFIMNRKLKKIEDKLENVTKNLVKTNATQDVY